MIHEGTISTGSAYTSGVVGVYWISSMRWLRNTTFPGVTATSLPTSKPSTPAGASSSARRCASSKKFMAPRHRLAPPLALMASSTSGLVQTKFEGDHMSSHCRPAKVTMFS